VAAVPLRAILLNYDSGAIPPSLVGHHRGPGHLGDGIEVQFGLHIRAGGGVRVGGGVLWSSSLDIFKCTFSPSTLVSRSHDRLGRFISLTRGPPPCLGTRPSIMQLLEGGPPRGGGDRLVFFMRH